LYGGIFIHLNEEIVNFFNSMISVISDDYTNFVGGIFLFVFFADR